MNNRAFAEFFFVRIAILMDSYFQTAAGSKISKRPSLKFIYPTTSMENGWLTEWWTCLDPSNFSTCSGIVKHMAGYIGEAMNMTVTTQLPTGNNFGREVAKGVWTPGAINDILEGRADFMLSTWDPVRCRVLQCYGFQTTTQYGVLVPIPDKKLVFDGFLQPFSPTVWLCLILSIAAMAVTLCALRKSHHFPQYNWTVLLATLLNQDTAGGTKTKAEPRTHFFRFIPWGMWLMAISILSMTYSALVIQFFMDPYQSGISSLTQLVNAPLDVQVSPTENVLIQYIRSSQKPDLKKLAKNLEEVPLDQLLTFYPNSTQAYIEDTLTLSLRTKGLMDKGDDKWTVCQEFVETQNFPRFYKTFMFRRNFTHLKRAKKAARALMERGLYKHWKQTKLSGIAEMVQWKQRALVPNGPGQKQKLEAVSFENVKGVMVLYLMGNFAAFLAFLLEILWSKRLEVCTVLLMVHE